MGKLGYLFTNRINVLEHKPLDFVAVGVGPLSLDEKYVTKGEPAGGLDDDLNFMAEQSGFLLPPLPPTTKREFGMIKNFCKRHPQPKTVDIQRQCMVFKSKANGKDIFPKLPTMIKPAIKRWKVNSKIALLKLQCGDVYTAILNQMKSRTTILPPPTNPRPNRRTARQLPQEATQNNEDMNTMLLLPEPHVPPLCAPTQSSVIPGSNEALQVGSGRCAWWPCCKKDKLVCHGSTKDLCTYYGKHGKETPPSKSEFDRQKRLHTWKPDQKKKACVWHPYCESKQVDCGGVRRNLCSKYGNDGTHSDQASG